MSSVKLVHVTPEAEKHIVYCARVSSENQENTEIARLIKYCIDNGHWSIFEMASMCLEIKTSRAIAAQILRHKSFSFQEFSQRYSSVQRAEYTIPRKQAEKNRQSSVEFTDKSEFAQYATIIHKSIERSFNAYDQLIECGVAKECARMVLPLASQTKLYMHGTLRSWIHYFLLRTQEETQLEHREIAKEAFELFKNLFPIISIALGDKYGR